MATNYRTINISLAEDKLPEGVDNLLGNVKNAPDRFQALAFVFMDKHSAHSGKKIQIFVRSIDNGQRFSAFRDILGLQKVDEKYLSTSIKTAGSIRKSVKDFLEKEEIYEYASNLSDAAISEILKVKNWRSLISVAENFDERSAEKAGLDGEDFAAWYTEKAKHIGKQSDHIEKLSEAYLQGVEKRLQNDIKVLKKIKLV